MQAFYDNKPSKFEAVGNGSYIYRWNIKEEVVTHGDGTDDTTTTQYKCDEVTVWGTVTKDKLMEAVLAEVCPISRENKFINDFNAANLGVYGLPTLSEVVKKIADYKEFLVNRKKVKEAVKADCEELNIR